MAVRIGKVKSGVVDFARDATALAVTGILGYSLPLIGGVISYFLAPRIASERAKDFSRAFAILITVDSVIERMFGSRGIV